MLKYLWSFFSSDSYLHNEFRLRFTNSSSRWKGKKKRKEYSLSKLEPRIKFSITQSTIYKLPLAMLAVEVRGNSQSRLPRQTVNPLETENLVIVSPRGEALASRLAARTRIIVFYDGRPRYFVPFSWRIAASPRLSSLHASRVREIPASIDRHTHSWADDIRASHTGKYYEHTSPRARVLERTGSSSCLRCRYSRRYSSFLTQDAETEFSSLARLERRLSNEFLRENFQSGNITSCEFFSFSRV